MKSTNLARRIETLEDDAAIADRRAPEVAPQVARPERPRKRLAFRRRAIEIRDQGFAPFRVR